MDNIRVTYSGLLGFAVAIAGIFAGLAFTIVVTRQLEPEEFGTWAVIGSMVSYSVITEPIVSYWTTRQTARNRPVGSTSVVSTSIFAGGSVPVYIVSAYLFTNIESVVFNSIILGAILVPVLFIRSILAAINIGHKPHGVSIGLAVFQFTKIPAGLGLVYILGLGLDGAIFTVFVAHLAEISVLLHYAWPKIIIRLNFCYLRGWIRQFWIPLYGKLSGVVLNLDIVFYTIITESVVGAAYYAAALVIAKIVSRVSVISQALYPKLLAEGSHDHITENLTYLMYFAIPMLIFGSLFSKYVLFLLNPGYAAAWIIGVLLTLNAFLHVIIGFLQQVLTGTDAVDVDERPHSSALLNSKLFLVNTIANVHHALYLIILIITLFIFSNLSDLDLVTAWSLVVLLVSVPFVFYYARCVQKYASFRVPHVAIFKYLIGGGVAGVIFVFTHEHIIKLDVSVYSYLPGLLSEMTICCAAYFGITYAIDRKTRRLFGLVLAEIMSRHKK